MTAKRLSGTATKAKAKPKIIRGTFTPESLVQELARSVTGFQLESPTVQLALATMIWIGTDERRVHSVYEDHMSFHFQELRAAFGGRFSQINARLNFFEVSEGWWASLNACDGFTKSYRMTPLVAQCRDRLLSTCTPMMTRLLSGNGEAFKTLGRPVSSKDMAGVTTSRWRAANAAAGMSRVPVNIGELSALHNDLSRVITDLECDGRQLDEPVATYPSRDYLLRLRVRTAQILQLAHTDVAGVGYVMHRYTEAKSGRIYANSVNLATCPKVIRQAALYGLWDYDIENCHIAILAQMAVNAGGRCASIDDYVLRKAEVRAEIAGSAGISISSTKNALIALAYGAGTTARATNSIPRALGAAAARRLYEQPLFAALARDVTRARACILVRYGLNRQGGLVNAFGKSIKAAAHNPGQLLAHLVQGVEAQALRTCIERHPGEIVLAQHDGFTATSRVPVHELEVAILASTGYRLALSEEPVRVDLAGQLRRAADKEFSKARRASKPNAGPVHKPFHARKPRVNTAPPSLPMSIFH